ncbi:Serine/threonine-protein kinase TOR [Gossypium arboreum]|uniref:Serine/threonine-protein kinase TOR n=1 Tax=Gossypium arboreum TaxID=29729 RepID=A0A0B0PRT9_GOSAR|nr:Serine/threonine-protein kinase TOR [Gossypium arboreum]
MQMVHSWLACIINLELGSGHYHLDWMTIPYKFVVAAVTGYFHSIACAADIQLYPLLVAGF